MSDDNQLFPPTDEIKCRVKLTHAIGTMYQRHGRCTGKICGECKHFIVKKYSYRKVYFKCGHYADSASPATDFRKSFPACGLFEEIP